MPRLFVPMLVAVAAAFAAPVAQAAQPIITPAPVADFVDTTSCAFPVSVHFTVNRETAKKMEWLMPFPSLLERLEEKTKGRVLDAELGLAADRPPGWTAAAWSGFVAKTDVQPLWIDYTLEQ